MQFQICFGLIALRNSSREAVLKNRQFAFGHPAHFVEFDLLHNGVKSFLNNNQQQ
jgi:hypothetical protein